MRLDKFTAEEVVGIRETIGEAAKAAEAIVSKGLDKAMNLYNVKK